MSVGTDAGAAIINGRRMPLVDAALALTDDGVARGDGGFETIGVWSGRIFRLDDHLERLGRSLAAIGLPQPDIRLLRSEAQALVAGIGEVDAALRVYVTGSGSRVLTLADPPPLRRPSRLAPQPAPWIRPRGTYQPAGAKTMSYGPNMAATRAAQRDGADDALLISLEGLVLEGPTFCVLWVRDGSLFAPALDLGIVDSLSRRTLLEIARAGEIKVSEGHWTLDELADADEIMTCSSLRELGSVRRVGRLRFEGPTPMRDRLAAGLDARRRDR